MLGFIKTSIINCSKNAKKNLNSFSVTIKTKANDVAKLDWNSVLQKKHIFLSLAYLDALEKSLPNGVTTLYVTVYSKSKPIFITYLHLYTFTKAQLNALKSQNEASNIFVQIIRNALQNVLIKFIQIKKMKLLVMGNILQTGEYSYASNTNNENHLIIEKVLHQIKASYKIDAIILKDFNTNNLLNNNIQKNGFVPLYTQPNMELKIAANWLTLTDYINSLNVKYKKRWKSAFNKFNAVEKYIFTIDDLIKNENEIYNLFENVYENSSYKINKIKPNYFTEFKNKFPNSFNVIGYYLNNELVAFASYFIDNKTLEANYIGLNYNYNSTHKLYQNILYDYTNIAIENKCTTLYLSRTGLEIKSTIGAMPEYLSNFIRLENKLLHNILNPIFKNIKQEPFEQRNPFK